MAGLFTIVLLIGVVLISLWMNRDRVERVRERFMQADELDSLSTDHRLEHLYVYWCGKEALYKITGKPEPDFRNDLHILPFDYLCTDKGKCRGTITDGQKVSEHLIHYRKIGDYMVVIAL